MTETWSEELRYNYPLNKDSVVLDVGGFEGDWAIGIYKKYDCNIFIFEPVKAFHAVIKSKFQEIHTARICKIYNIGLGTKDETIRIGVTGMSTSVFNKSTRASEWVENEWVEIKDVRPILNNFDKVDLIKLNIEGGEYDLLEYIIANGAQTKLVNIQIQFHNNVTDYENRREKIRGELAKTHHLTYDFPVGLHENWELNK